MNVVGVGQLSKSGENACFTGRWVVCWTDIYCIWHSGPSSGHLRELVLGLSSAFSHPGIIQDRGLSTESIRLPTRSALKGDQGLVGIQQTLSNLVVISNISYP